MYFIIHVTLYKAQIYKHYLTTMTPNESRYLCQGIWIIWSLFEFYSYIISIVNFLIEFLIPYKLNIGLQSQWCDCKQGIYGNVSHQLWEEKLGNHSWILQSLYTNFLGTSASPVKVFGYHSWRFQYGSLPHACSKFNKNKWEEILTQDFGNDTRRVWLMFPKTTISFG